MTEVCKYKVSISDVATVTHKDFQFRQWFENLDTTSQLLYMKYECSDLNALILKLFEVPFIQIHFSRSIEMPRQPQEQEEIWGVIFSSKQLMDEKTNSVNNIKIMYPHLPYVVNYLPSLCQFLNEKNEYLSLVNKQTEKNCIILIKNVQTKWDMPQPLFSNLVALSATCHQEGERQNESIYDMFLTILNAFLQIKQQAQPNTKITFNTGNWGCSQHYGKNPTFIAIIQFLAAEIAQIDFINYNFADFEREVYLGYIIFERILQRIHSTGTRSLEDIKAMILKLDIPKQKDIDQSNYLQLGYLLCNDHLYCLSFSSRFFEEERRAKGKIFGITKYKKHRKRITYYLIMHYLMISGIEKGNMQGQGIGQINLACRFDFGKIAKETSTKVNEGSKDNFLGLSFNDPENVQVFDYVDLLGCKIKLLFSHKKYLYDKFMSNHKEIVMMFQQCQDAIRCIRCFKQIPLPPPYLLTIGKRCIVTSIQGGFEYISTRDRFQWYLNFADDELFGFYESSLFAQDEIQTTEHPILYHLKHKLLEIASSQQKSSPKLFKENGEPTPFLIINIPRQGSISFKKTAQNKNGIYGNNFAQATTQDIESASSIILPKQRMRTNLIVMCSQKNGSGAYKREEIQKTFEMAYKSFREAYAYSKHTYPRIQVEINTGNWGCGAFGNNLQFIALIQLLASEVAQVDYLVYHTFNAQGQEALQKAQEMFAHLREEVLKNNSYNYQDFVSEFLERIYQISYQWSVSDGN